MSVFLHFRRKAFQFRMLSPVAVMEMKHIDRILSFDFDSDTVTGISRRY